MDVDLLVMTAAARHGVQASDAETFAGPVPGSMLTAVTFGTEDEAAVFAGACMAESIPARRYGAAVLILHD
jgi:hypothetical protein